MGVDQCLTLEEESAPQWGTPARVCTWSLDGSALGNSQMAECRGKAGRAPPRCKHLEMTTGISHKEDRKKLKFTLNSWHKGQEKQPCLQNAVPGNMASLTLG